MMSDKAVGVHPDTGNASQFTVVSEFGRVRWTFFTASVAVAHIFFYTLYMLMCVVVRKPAVPQ